MGYVGGDLIFSRISVSSLDLNKSIEWGSNSKSPICLITVKFLGDKRYMGT